MAARRLPATIFVHTNRQSNVPVSQMHVQSANDKKQYQCRPASRGIYPAFRAGPWPGFVRPPGVHAPIDVARLRTSVPAPVPANCRARRRDIPCPTPFSCIHGFGGSLKQPPGVWGLNAPMCPGPGPARRIGLSPARRHREPPSFKRLLPLNSDRKSSVCGWCASSRVEIWGMGLRRTWVRPVPRAPAMPTCHVVPARLRVSARSIHCSRKPKWASLRVAGPEFRGCMLWAARRGGNFEKMETAHDAHFARPPALFVFSSGARSGLKPAADGKLPRPPLAHRLILAQYCVWKRGLARPCSSAAPNTLAPPRFEPRAACPLELHPPAARPRRLQPSHFAAPDDSILSSKARELPGRPTPQVHHRSEGHGSGGEPGALNRASRAAPACSDQHVGMGCDSTGPRSPPLTIAGGPGPPRCRRTGSPPSYRPYSAMAPR